MRSRLAAAFCALAFVVITAFATTRVFSLDRIVNDEGMHQVHETAALVARAATAHLERHDDLDSAWLRDVVGASDRVQLTRRGRIVGTATGADFRRTRGSLTATTTLGDLSVDVTRDGRAQDRELRKSRQQVLVLAAVLLVLSLLAGLVLGRWWGRPFAALAQAAQGLGRGRFDIAPPNSRIPEVRQIGEALSGAAASLEARVRQERAFVEQASHVIRTPLTALRLELEDLGLRSDVDDETKDTAKRCLI